MRNPQQRLIVIGGHLGTMGSMDVAVESAALNQIHAGGGNPIPLVVSGSDLPLWPDAHAVGRAMSSGDYFHLAAILADLYETAVMRNRCGPKVASLGEIKIAFRVGGQVHAKLVVMIADRNIVVKILIKIRLAIVVEIVKARDLVAA